MSAPGKPPANDAGRDTVAWLADRARLSDDGKALAEDAGDASVLVDRLVAAGLAPDALRVVASALPPREGVWWAWVSARHAAQLAGDKGALPEVTEALASVEQWIATPEDGPRRAAWAASERVGLDTPAGCAAAAPFFTSGSVAPPEVAPIPPPPGLHAVLIGTAVTLSATADPEHFDALVDAYLKQGLEVVRQLGGWGSAVTLARRHFDEQLQRHRELTRPSAKASDTSATH